ncbi:MAG TPA: winged helix-turn-helix transcriptional regulator [archaeon]|nr:winged helix-turn-helix transcriptional regulator [archaeon]
MTEVYQHRESNAILDNADKALIYALDRNSRRSNSEIAKEIRVKKNLVGYRIKKLIDDDIILGFYSVVDTTALGFEGYRVYLKWQYISPEKEKEIINFFVNAYSTWWVGSIEGEWDAGIILWVKNAYKFREFWLELMGKYQKYIMKYLVCVYSKVFDFNYAFISPKEKPEKNTIEVGFDKKTEITETQEKILKVISENSRMPTVEISKSLELTPMIVKHNLKKLLKLQVIKGFRVRLNLEKLGYTYYKINFWLKDRSRYSEIMSYAQAHPNIIYVNETIGYADFEAELLAERHSQFQEILEEMSTIFGNTIKEKNYFVYNKIHKIKYY